jgi:cell division protein FtsW
MKKAVTMLVFCVASLLALGIVMLYSSSMANDSAHFLIMQLVWCGLGLIFCMSALAVDYRVLKKFAWPLFALTVLLLVLVLVPGIGLKVKGARRWLGYGSFRFQCSELAKLALIIVLAWYGERFQRQMPTWKKGTLVPALIISVVLGLIFVEPDRGTTILLASVSAVMLVIAGVRWSYLVPPVLMAAAGLAYSIYNDPMRTKRIFSWLYLEDHKSGVGYQGYQAMLALGAGGPTGLGLGNSRQKMGFVPENHTDFIFSIIGEEMGLIATLLVIVAFILIITCGLYIAINSRDTFGMLLGCGISFLIGMQAFINIGVVTSALPNKGLPLPFISYGGSSLMVMLFAVGLLLSIAKQAQTVETLGARRAEADPVAAPQAT